MCIEREKDNFKSREVNCLKECALALRPLGNCALMTISGLMSFRNLHWVSNYNLLIYVLSLSICIHKSEYC